MFKLILLIIQLQNCFDTQNAVALTIKIKCFEIPDSRTFG